MSVIRRGDTFDFSGPLELRENGVRRLDMTGWQVFAQLRRLTGELIADLQCTWLDATQSLCRVHATDSTVGWPLGGAVLEIRAVDASGTVSVATQPQRMTIDRSWSEANAS